MAARRLLHFPASIIVGNCACSSNYKFRKLELQDSSQDPRFKGLKRGDLASNRVGIQKALHVLHHTTCPAAKRMEAKGFRPQPPSETLTMLSQAFGDKTLRSRSVFLGKGPM